MIPQVGQGAIGIECQSGDIELLKALKQIEDPKTRTLVDTERQFLIHVGADCSNAVAGHATYEQENIRLRTFLGNEETNQNTFDDRIGLDGETLGRDAAKALTVIGT